MTFASDTWSGAAPEVLDALARVSASGPGAAYGDDDETAALEARLKEVFEHDLRVFPVVSGTAANALGLSALCPPWGAVLCHGDSHVYTDECGAPEFIGGGLKTLALSGADGKIDPQALSAALEAPSRGVHESRPAALSLTQATESGTVYTPDETRDLAERARAQGLRVMIDGARFANALVHLDCSPAEASWRAGADLLCLGTSKNGTLGAEAIVVFDPALAETLPQRRKRSGHLVAKNRFLAAQILALLEDDLWLTLARRANILAETLADGLTALGLVPHWPVQSNTVFTRLPEPVEKHLLAAGFAFHRWDGENPPLVRLVTSFDTPKSEVERFLAETGTALLHKNDKTS